MANANAIFNQADTNHDQRLDLNEFRNLIAQNLGSGASASIYTGNVLDGGQYSASSYESSSTGTYGDLSGTSGGFTNVTDAGNIGANASYSSYEQSSTGGAIGEYDGNAQSNINITGAAGGISASSSSFEAGSTQQNIQQYATNSQGLYQDPNPQVIRRPAQGGQVTYTQNIKIRFLQPPAIPPPGVKKNKYFYIIDFFPLINL